VTGLLDLSREQESERFLPNVLPWVHDAGNPYFDYLFGDSDSAQENIMSWMRRPSSEIAIERCRILQQDERIVGGFVGLNGAELKKCRKADMMVLMKTFSSQKEVLLNRLAALRALFRPVPDDTYYLSKLGVLPQFRGIGLGRKLTKAFLTTGKKQGFSRFQLDVSCDNIAAVHLYSNLGFQIDKESSAGEETLRYYSMVLHG